MSRGLMDKLAHSAYRHQLIIQNIDTGKPHNVTKLIKEVVYTTELMTGAPGKVEIMLTITPTARRSRELDFLTKARIGEDVKHGHIVQYSVNGKGVFLGYITKVGQDALNTVMITAYDQIFWLGSKDIYYRFDKTASQVFADICTRKTHPQIQYRIDTPSRVVLEPYNFSTNETLYSIIEQSIDMANIGENKRYLIRDEFGTLVFTEVGELYSGIRLGDYEYIIGYQYESSIQSDTYNHIKVFRANEELGMYDTWVAQDGDTMKRWGRLTRLVEADERLTEAEIIAKAEKFLEFFNRPNETMSILGMGHLGVYAGNIIRLNIEGIELRGNFWVTSAIHTFRNFYHSMDLEVFYV